MMTSATKSEEKRRDWSVQRGVDHNKIRVNQAVETRNRAQFLGQVPKQQRKSYRRLARGTKHRQHARKGILLGECRLRTVATNFPRERFAGDPVSLDIPMTYPEDGIRETMQESACFVREMPKWLFERQCRDLRAGGESC